MFCILNTIYYSYQFVHFVSETAKLHPNSPDDAKEMTMFFVCIGD